MATATHRATKATTTKRDVCGLTLRINGERYAVRPVQAKAFGAKRAFVLRKANGDKHHVIGLVTGPECDCGDFTFRRDGIDPRGCKHIRAMRACGLID